MISATAQHTEPQGPLMGVPAWYFDRRMPEHWLHRMVSLCLEWSDRSIHRLPLQNRGIDDEELLVVGLAMRDVNLLAHAGHDIRSAWETVSWPEGIAAIRKDVCWELSERARKARDRAAAIADLFDRYDPILAPRRARMAASSAKAQTREGDTKGARESAAFAALQSQIAEARRTRDEREFVAGAALWAKGVSA